MLLLNFCFIVTEHFMKGDKEFLIFHLFFQYMASIFCSHTVFPALLDVLFFFSHPPSHQVYCPVAVQMMFLLIDQLIMKLDPPWRARNQGRFGFLDNAFLGISQYFLPPPFLFQDFVFLVFIFLLLPSTPAFYEIAIFFPFFSQFPKKI